MRKTRAPRGPFRPPPVPKHVLRAMVAGGALRDEVVGEDLRVMRIDRVGSDAWNTYRDWAWSKGKVDPIVQAVYSPTIAMHVSSFPCAPLALAYRIQVEANSIVHHLAPLLLADAASTATLPDPLSTTVLMTKMRDAKVAVTVVIEAIANPGANYPVINSLQAGVYICHVQYIWHNAVITAPVVRSE